MVRSVRMLGDRGALTDSCCAVSASIPPGPAPSGHRRSRRTREALIQAAKAWIAANPDALQPWDVDRSSRSRAARRRTRGRRASPELPANLRKQLGGANYPAPHHILAAAVEGAQVDFENASEIEGRYFVDLVDRAGREEHDPGVLLRPQSVNGDRGRPARVRVPPGGRCRARRRDDGRGIAYVSAKAGIEVVLKDVSLEAAQRGKGYSEKLVAKDVERGGSSQEAGDALLARITPADDRPRRAGADLVIEAVFEDPAVKAHVFAEIAPHLAPTPSWPRTPHAADHRTGAGASRPA